MARSISPLEGSAYETMSSVRSKAVVLVVLVVMRDQVERGGMEVGAMTLLDGLQWERRGQMGRCSRSSSAHAEPRVVKGLTKMMLIYDH